MRLSKLHTLLEYGGLEPGRIHLDDVIEVARNDEKTLIAIQCLSGYSAKALAGLHAPKRPDDRNMHYDLIQKAAKDGIRDTSFAVRAYWAPNSGRLMVYQMETKTGMVVDPPEEMISLLVRNLNIDKDIMQLDIIE
jgi:hypothetical protein